MKLFDSIKKFLLGFTLVTVAMMLLIWAGFFNSVKRVPPEVLGTIEVNLRIQSETGNADAQNKLATLLYTRAKENNGDYDEAIEWFEKASNQNHPVAQMNLAYAYKSGNGVPLNKEKAIQFFYQSGLNYLRLERPTDAMDSAYNIHRLNSIHPLKRDLINAIKRKKESAN